MYAKVFSQIFDSSIADDYKLRHFFTDLLVLADEHGVVDMTHQAIAARTRMPLALVRRCLIELEKPDPRSRTAKHEGRRIVRLENTRDWGWLIVNHDYYRALATEQQRKENTKQRVRRFRAKEPETMQLLDIEGCNGDVTPASVSVSVSESVGGGSWGRFSKPVIDAVKLQGAKIGLPDSECEKFFDYYEANGWRVGKNPMRLWTAALANWKRHWIEYGGLNGKTNQQSGKQNRGKFDRNAGTLNNPSDYAGYTGKT